ncbi:cytidylyltransferase domain-containing protein [Niveispirillum irakense]|uniref:acylneuraminate cytidylyltransferase family protein n=1 Tax=Niveispirillum irakense TaxID=34011 RepID=UPI00040F51C1|nr:acylneuraminate cytidylyltransferase family protein [Niveispirillum irakense]
MIQGRRVLAVCPARGGSKGIPMKNLRPILGRPMVSRVGDVVRAVPAIDRAVISTDHDGIAQVAEEAGLAAPFRRPEDLSGDRVADLPVLIHALQEMERQDNVRYDIILMLQPTSPLRRPEHVQDCLDRLVEGGLDSAWTVSETDSKGHPLKQLTIKDGRLDYYDQAGRQIIARQQLGTVYHRNGVCYAITRECLLEKNSIAGDAWGAVVIDEPMVSIDTEFDIALVEFLMRYRDGAGSQG